MITTKSLTVEQYGHLLTYLLHPEANAILGEHRSFDLQENIIWLHKEKKRTLEYINNQERYIFSDYQLAAISKI